MSTQVHSIFSLSAVVMRKERVSFNDWSDVEVRANEIHRIPRCNPLIRRLSRQACAREVPRLPDYGLSKPIAALDPPGKTKQVLNPSLQPLVVYMTYLSRYETRFTVYAPCRVNPRPPQWPPHQSSGASVHP